jgi:hypothetical protein
MGLSNGVFPVIENAAVLLVTATMYVMFVVAGAFQLRVVALGIMR